MKRELVWVSHGVSHGGGVAKLPQLDLVKYEIRDRFRDRLINTLESVEVR